ncbi:RNA polymerase subunit sigma-70 [Comamonas serinivorans]|uniref:RNA polymerase subunit sigma-70 n=1 Tax=Comamonas serinivorans TaxID=1082851 RepID=A0A1Y0EPC4_9BURK|nr:anti-sigma factor [Comamonas serinivorans]ARU05483.1 RNA polymerase subunit sigma-70 [Comamonas serinivorans]
MSGDTDTPWPIDEGPENDLQVQAGEYVLGTLSAVQRRAVESRLPYEPELHAAVQAWEQRLLPLTRLVPPLEPSTTLWSRISSSIPPARSEPLAHRRAWWHWDSLALWRTLAAGSFTAAALLAAVLLVREASPPAAPRYFVVLTAPQNQAPGWVVQAQAEGRLRLVPLGKGVIPAENSLQFWTKADGWSAPVSLGLVKPGEAIEVPVDRLPPLQPNQLFELTLEPKGGSPIGRPTGPIQFIGRAVQI